MIGFIGAGNMAGALARGWGEPVLATDSGSGRAAALVEELGGETLGDNAELVRRADAVVLGHKPYQLEQVAAGVGDAATGKTVISILGGTSIAQLQAAFPQSTVIRAVPNTPVALRRGVTCIAEGGEQAVALFERVGSVFVLPESQMSVALATTSVMPAYVALVAEAAIDAGVRGGLPAARATEMFLATLAGSAELLIARGGDTLTVRREVTSPGGSTARGLAALERNGLRTAFDEALQAVIGG
ncbi:pyrroline-5-carboxylate reductase family protein [Capillimicrobium parvum]|uniref:Pyrroline-5-carboxylate reductase n=1 Tax=Capillimicrobium parvum TaxID=2884022 RepID=A0A9E7C0F4_9ACTN|nr:pyrroline-5-carboxylate reductase [Capillimicrobium parvum]UGS36316.1 Pyrroline-5-carboxylate reductase [Capillimicrobium parvum]